MYAVGFSGDIVVVRNSWGADWGDDGNVLVSAAWIAQCDAFAWDVQKEMAA